MLFIVYADSGDWCGCTSDTYLVMADTEDEAMDTVAILGTLEDQVLDFYTADTEDEDYIAEPDIRLHAEQYEEYMHGSVEDYPRLN